MQKKTGEELELYQFVMENAPITILFIDSEARIRFANKAALKHFGYSMEELLTKTIPDVNPVFSMENWSEHWQNLKDRKAVPVETFHQRKNGEIFPIEVAANYIEFGDVAYNVAFIKDNTQRKKNEQALRNSEKELRNIFDKLQDTYYRTDIEGRVTMSSPSVVNLMGETSEEMLGKTLAEYYVDPDGRAKFLAALTENGGSVRNYEAEIRKLDGTIIWVSTNAQLLRDDNGLVIGVEGAIRDISDRKILEDQLRQSQKLQALGTLVGGIAHEFNNTLAGIVGNLFLAKQEAWSLPDVVSKLDTIEKLTYNSAELIKSLLSFARKDIIQKVPVVINDQVKEVLKLERVSLPENIELRSEIAVERMVCDGDPNLFQQILLNIINNAGDALEESDEPLITVTLEPFTADELFYYQNPECKAKEYAHITVTDNGCGIPAANLPHILEPFHTTKPVGKGTGLGLSMAYGAIQSHNGALNIDSEPGNGTRIDIYFPTSTAKENTASQQHDGVAIPGKGETILLVDDNESILTTGESILESLNYKVITARNGKEAVAAYRTHASTIDLVLTDVVMPVMGGVDAVNIMRESDPDLNVIFMTGYDRNNLQKAKADHIETETIVVKPLLVPELSVTLRNILDK